VVLNEINGGDGESSCDDDVDIDDDDDNDDEDGEELKVENEILATFKFLFSEMDGDDCLFLVGFLLISSILLFLLLFIYIYVISKIRLYMSIKYNTYSGKTKHIVVYIHTKKLRKKE